MSARAVRSIVLVVCATGIAGMIASSIADNNGAVLTFGLATAVSVLCLIVATAVAAAEGGAGGAAPSGVEALGAEVEARVAGLVGQGCEEGPVRDLVRDAVRLGQALER